MASVAISTALTAVLTYTAAGVAWGQVVAMFLISSAAYLMRKEPVEDAVSNMTGGGIKQNTRSTQARYRVIYGKAKIGGNDVFVETTGDDNKNLWIVQNLAEGECEGITQEAGTDQIFLDEKLPSEYGGNVSYWFHSGSSTQTYDTNLNSAISKWTDNKRYTCYIVWRLHYDRDYFQSLPKRTILLKGLKLYDFRDSTTAWSDNPVLALYDYFTNTRYGMGEDASKVDITSWTDAANYCNTKGWTLNLVLDGEENAVEVLDLICEHFRGSYRWYDGKVYLSYADLNYESSVKTLNDTNIARDDSGRALVSISQPSQFQKPDGLTVQYIDPDKGWIADTIQIGESEGDIKEISLVGCTQRQQAADLGVYRLERMQLDRTISGVFRDDAIELEPNDVITFTSDALSISSQLMRVVSARIQGNWLVNLDLEYEDEDLYNDDYDLDTEGTYTCTLPDPLAEPGSISSANVTEETFSYRDRTFTRLKITFNEPADYPWYDYVEVWVSDEDANYKHQFNVRDNFNIENVEEGETYWIRLKTVSIFGTKTSNSSDYKLSYLVGGYTQAPESLSSLAAVVNANSINLYATKVTDTDVEHYEFRLGNSWSGAIFLAALRAPNLSLYGVKPGAHTFWCNTLGNNDIYGDSPQSATVTLPDPPQSWTVQSTETDDYTSSAGHDNTEHTTYSGDDYLKCSHLGSSATPYTGTYTSPIFDLGASGQYLVYVLADIVVTGTGTTWNDVIPDTSVVSTTWSDINIDTRTWTQIFELSEGPQVKIRLKYGETSPPSTTVEKMELLGTVVTGRYFQIEIEIQDPSSSINALVENFTLKFCQ